MSRTAAMAGFLGLSAELTGFSVFDLRGTGEADAYLDTADAAAGTAVIDALIAAHSVLSGTGAERSAKLRRTILGDPVLGPVARNIIKMWFSGTWYRLPEAWVAACGPVEKNVSFTVRASSYPEGLLWKTIGANPPGAKAPGYGSWAEPPRIPDPEQGFAVLSRELPTKP